MGYLEDLIKAKLVQLGDTTLKTVAPIVRHARTRAKVTREAEEGTNRLWQLRTLPKVIQQDNRTTTQKAKDRKEADERHLQYQQQLNELKATEGFNNLLKLTSPSTYVEAATGLQLTPAGKLATDILTFGMAGGVKSLLTRGGSKAISSPSIIRTVQNNGKIRLSLPSHTDTNPRLFVLEPQGNNKYYVHMRTWDGDHIPANLNTADKLTLFQALYNELPDGAEILFPKSGPGYYGTRGTVAGLLRLARDPRFTPGTRGVLLYLDKNGDIKTYKGTSFIKTSPSQRTLGLVKRISGEIPTTPAEWTAAQDAAIARGDMAEAQRLRDLHFKVSAPNTKVIDENGNPLMMYHGTDSEGDYILRHNGVQYKPNGLNMFFTSNYYGQYLGGTKTKSVPLYINATKVGLPGNHYEIGRENPLKYLKKDQDALYEWGFLKNNDFATDEAFEAAQNTILPKEVSWAKSKGFDLDLDNIDKLDAPRFLKAVEEDINTRGIGHHPVEEFAVPKGEQVKLADAVTYNNNGVRIPLGERDNFNINDIRWFSTHPITRASKVHLTRNNPLQTRLARLREHTRYGFTPETNLGLMITPRIRSNYVKAFAKQIDPNLTEELLNLIAQIAYANGRGMHIPIGNDIGETVGGLSIVDIQNAIKYLKLSGIKDVTPNDIGIIAGHEAGHGVLISPAAKRAIEGFSEPDEFYTRAGQVLDAAGITATADNPVTYNKFVNLIDKYLKQGNLDNGVSKLKQFMIKLSPLERQKIMKYINRLSAGTGLTYLINE